MVDIATLCEIQEIEVVIIHKEEQPSFEEELAKGRTRNHHCIFCSSLWFKIEEEQRIDGRFTASIGRKHNC